LECKYSWITEEKQYFGSSGGSYDFNEKNPQETGKRIAKLQEKSEKLGRNINTRAMNLLGKKEEQVKSWFQAYHLPITSNKQTNKLRSP
jgi:structural maintenance of chromosome 2